MPTRDEVIEALRQVEDPELGMDIVDLGLLYDVEVEGPRVKVTHSLTSMGCPVGPMIQEDINRVTRELPGVEDVDVVHTKAQTMGARGFAGPMSYPGVGRFSVIADPQGAVISLFKGESK